MSRPITKLDESNLQVLLELEITSKDFFDLEVKLQNLIDHALESKIPMQQIASSMGISLFRVKYLAEKKRGVK